MQNLKLVNQAASFGEDLLSGYFDEIRTVIEHMDDLNVEDTDDEAYDDEAYDDKAGDNSDDDSDEDHQQAGYEPTDTSSVFVQTRTTQMTARQTALEQKAIANFHARPAPPQGSAWEKALVEQGLTQGSGDTEDDPCYVGGRDFKDTAPATIPPDRDPAPYVTVL